MDIKPIRGEVDYERALRRVEELWNASGGSTESDELDFLATLIEADQCARVFAFLFQSELDRFDWIGQVYLIVFTL
jgi:antitoxin component HigA of HigAB toxin-antitoxin module